MSDPALIGIRFALYADLMLVAGLAAFLLYALTRDERASPELTDRIWHAERWLCAAGLLVSAFGMGVLAASMQGVGLLALDAQSFQDIVRQSDAGTAWLYRSAALAAALAASIWMRRWPNAAAMLLVAAAMAAVATLAWSGHAGAAEGAAGIIHRVGDIVHMTAAAVWIGALAAFVLLLHPRCPGGAAIAARSLEQFSTIGTICVLLIAGTGLLNGQMIIGAQNLGRSLAAPYGQLLLAKLALFALMLALAAANRWRFTPALGAAIAQAEASRDENSSGAIITMRKSLIVEATAAFTILALVAWLGTLDPFGSEGM